MINGTFPLIRKIAYIGLEHVFCKEKCWFCIDLNEKLQCMFLPSAYEDFYEFSNGYMVILNFISICKNGLNVFDNF